MLSRMVHISTITDISNNEYIRCYWSLESFHWSILSLKRSVSGVTLRAKQTISQSCPMQKLPLLKLSESKFCNEKSIFVPS